jgi:hypothetical protein
MADASLSDIENLKKLAEAGGGGWVAANDPEFVALTAVGFVKTDGAPDADGDVYYALTPAGIAAIGGNAAPVAVPAAASAVPLTGVPIAEPVPAETVAEAWPQLSRTIVTEQAPWNTYRRNKDRVRDERNVTLVRALDLDSFPVGGSKHIKPTEKVPKPWTTYASMVSIASRRYSTPKLDASGAPIMMRRKKRGGKDGEEVLLPALNYSRRFIIYKAHDDDPEGPGARVMRVPVDVDGE